MFRITCEYTPEPEPLVAQGTPPADGEAVPGVPPDFQFPDWVPVKRLDPATLLAIFQLLQMGAELIAKLIAFIRERRKAR
jgi:hypothetical protein